MTLEETTRIYPGDELVSKPYFLTTHSTLINAESSAIWPWLVQLGYHRAGWYIDTWWDELLNKTFWQWVVPKYARPEYRPSADRILDEYQNLKVCNTIPDGPPGTAFYQVVGLEPNQYLLLLSDSHFKYMTPPFLHNTKWEMKGSFSWGFILDNIDEGSTQLTIRARARFEPRYPLILSKPFFRLVDTLHVHAMLKGIRKRVLTHIQGGEYSI